MVNTAAILNSENIVINIAVANADFAASQGWIMSDTAKIGDRYDPDSGEFITPEPPPPQIPESVPALSGLLALDSAGLSDDYEAWAKDPSRTFAERAFIDKAMTWRRADPVIAAAAEALGLSDDDVDELFIAASQI